MEADTPSGGGSSNALPGSASAELSPPPQPPPSSSSTPGTTPAARNNTTSNAGAATAAGKPICRFFATKSGCRAGDACPFIHDASGAAGQKSATSTSNTVQPSSQQRQHAPGKERVTPSRGTSTSVSPGQTTTATTSTRRPDNLPPVEPSRIVQRPVPQAQLQNPRDFELSQVRRRFNPKESSTNHGTALVFKMTPTDPDFPFDIDALECTLVVPSEYPSTGRPTVKCSNKEMGRGYQVNVERGFDDIVSQHPGLTLIQLLGRLDRELETFLAAPKAETIKLVTNLSKAGSSQDTRTSSKAVQPPQPATLPPPEVPKPVVVVPVYSKEQKEQAESKRASETRQLEARLGRLPMFAKRPDGVTFTIPIEPRSRDKLPPELQSIKTVKLEVPYLYNLESCSIEMVGVEGPAVSNVVEAFKTRVQANAQQSLLNHVNYLTQNMHNMTAQAAVPKDVAKPNFPAVSDAGAAEQLSIPETVQQPAGISGSDGEERSHIIRIPRPPEWNVPQGDSDDESDSSDYDSDEYSDEEHASGEDGHAVEESSTRERGIMVSFPFLELHGIELLELVSVCITVKCERCKDTLDINNLKNNAAGDYTGVRSESCKKCTNPLGIGYRMDTMHVNSVRAGYLDLDGCTVVDLLPSNFIPTCSDCSTPFPAPGLVSVRGESSMASCRECHQRMSFRIPEVKFLFVSAAAVRASRAPPRKKAKEKLGIVAGQELPKRGRCSHYSKSYRWFRFSCCSKVFPCDKCHDQVSDHPNEHANRMICGYCSREQHYRPEDCGICHSVLVGKKGRGFWEGGKGTRDKVRMSRKDPRKYKRRPGTVKKT
ncbi:hypothetical protein K402DRAFT_395274 [Aulographum hederae CBS 113979]|uniref:CHY-type domain-containing protein n=1 Tax=Aulographum hederae CBS 113979 TaxID=1176131 RepID=A0A6G1GVB8_9PEZI|nr:hypothetical protein K402DRAFT_395274 [Aulographum hederae CBS 113979]